MDVLFESRCTWPVCGWTDLQGTLLSFHGILLSVLSSMAEKCPLLLFQACCTAFLSRPPLTQLENIGSVYPLYVYAGNRPLGPILRQRQCSLMFMDLLGDG